MRELALYKNYIIIIILTCLPASKLQSALSFDLPLLCLHVHACMLHCMCYNCAWCECVTRLCACVLRCVLLLPQVRVGNLEYELGELEYQQPVKQGSDQLTIGVALGGGFLVIVIIITVIIYKRKKSSHVKRQ